MQINMSKNESKKDANKSGVEHPVYRDSVLGGLPPKKNVEQIERDTRPRENGRAPGSVRK